MLFFLFFLLTATITLTVLRKTLILKIQPKGSGTELHIFLILASVALIMLQLANIYVETLNTILYIVVFIFTPGFSLLNILKFKPNFSRIELVALVYPLSLASLATIGTITLILPSNLRAISLLLTITFLSIVSLSVTRKEKQKTVKKHHELVAKNKELILIVTLLIFVYFYMELYPEIASLPGLDISRNFLQALAFTKDTLGDFYHPSAAYPLFSIYQSSIIHTIKPSVETFQITTIFLNIFAILSFYAMASQYLERYGDHTPAIATLIWASFAGFGWLNFLARKISNSTASLFSLIEQTNLFSYGDITWRRLFFYLSMEASLALVFAVLYLLKRNDLSKTEQILLMTLLITPLPLMHPYGTYFLFFVLLCFTIIVSGELRQQLKCAAYSLIIASFASLPLNYIINFKAPAFSIAFLTFSEYVLIGLAIITIASLRDKASRKIDAIVNKILVAKHTGALIVTVLLILYFASLLLWFSGSFTFDVAGLDRSGYVPWLLYPVRLGLTGVLVIAAIYILFKNSKYRSRELGAILASVLLMIFVSRLVSTTQMQYVSEFTFDPDSWFSESIRKSILSFREERMFELFKIPLSIVASLFFCNIIQKAKSKGHKPFNQITVVGLISLMLITGMSSTLLGFQYYQTTKTNSPNSLELEIINVLRNSIYENGEAIIISPRTPSSYLDFTGATAIITESEAAWSSKWPELPMLVTRHTTSTPTYFYIHKKRDSEQLSNYTGSYLEHILSIASSHLENSEVEIKKVNNWSPPVSESTTALVIPYENQTTNAPKQLFYAYDTFSSANLNYTTILSNDPRITTYKTLVLPYDDTKTLDMITQLVNYDDNTTQNLIILNTNGFGPLLNMFGNTSSQYFTANGIMTHEYLQITPLQAPIIHTNDYVDVKATYTNNLSYSPFIMTTKYENYNMTYVNICPLISQNRINEENIGKCLANTLNNFVEIYDASSISSWFTEPSLLFRTFSGNGTIEVASPSIAFLSIGEGNSITIQTESSNNTFNNSNLTMKGYKTAHIKTSQMNCQKAYGFYIKLNVIDPEIILESDNSVNILLDNTNIEAQTPCVKMRGEVAFLARQPAISINGTIQFQDFYMLHPPTIYTDGRNTTLRGNINLQIYACDEYSIALPYEINSPITVKYEQPLMEFNETASIAAMVPYIVILVSIIITVTLLTVHKKKVSRHIKHEHSR